MAKKTISPQTKLKIVLEVLKEERHVSEIAAEYEVHVSAIHRWKQELLEGADKVYASTKADKKAAQAKREQDGEIENLYAQIDRLTTQLDWLKKKSEGIL